MKHQLTHFTRFIPAAPVQKSIGRWMRLGLWSGMIILFILNIAIRFTHVPFIQIARSTYTQALLAQKLLMQGQMNLAVKELNKVSTRTNILGETTSIQPQTTLWQKEKETMQDQLSYWESIASDYPEYRDAYLAMAKLGYILNKPEVISENLQKASLLDPNGSSIKVFENLTK